MKWIRLSQPADNALVVLNIEQTVRVRQPGPGDDDRAGAVIDLVNGQQQAVRETVDQVCKYLFLK
jgi:hypothetical protein